MEMLGNILLVIVSICTFISYFPQIVKCLITKKGEDLSIWSWILWVMSSLAYTLYAILCQSSVMLIVETALELFFCLVILVCAIVFRNKKDVRLGQKAEKGSELKFLDYANNEIIVNKCPACAYAQHEFSLPCGMIFENDLITISQDWELPINGFIVIAPKRHIEKFEELNDEERKSLLDYSDRVIKILRDNGVCENFNIIMEEKEGRHFHVWIMPRHKFMEEFGGITKNIGKIFEYACKNLKTKDNIDLIFQTVCLLKQKLN